MFIYHTKVSIENKDFSWSVTGNSEEEARLLAESQLHEIEKHGFKFCGLDSSYDELVVKPEEIKYLSFINYPWNKPNVQKCLYFLPIPINGEFEYSGLRHGQALLGPMIWEETYPLYNLVG